MSPEVERRNQRIGWVVSIGSHLILLLLFFFMLAWREPDPPLPEYGIELNFGLEEAGSGEDQPEVTAPQPEQSESENIEENVEEPADVQEDIMPADEETERVEDAVEEVQTQPEESPDVMENPTTPVESNREKADTESIKESAENKPVKEATEDIASGVSNTDSEAQESTSQGDQSDATGDQGDPRGSIDSRALYGSQGGGGGPSLDLSGWIWDFEPRPNDTSNENGKIVFEIKIDDRGEIISVRTLEKSVSPQVERIYKQEVESLTFSPLSSSTIPAPVSTGKITFIIKSK